MATRTLEELEQAAARLSPDEYAQFRKWILEHDAEYWDRQLEKAVESGTFDELAEQARQDHQTGKTQPL